MSCLALSLQPVNGPDIMLQTREWFPPSRALMALSSFRLTRHSSSSSLLGDDPLAAASGQVVVGVESRYRVVYRLVNSIYILAVTTIDDSNNNAFHCIAVVNQAVAIVVAACRGVDVTPEKLAKKYAEIYMALDIILRGATSIRLSAILASMHGDSVAKMLHSTGQTEEKIRGADSWRTAVIDAIHHQSCIYIFSGSFFELPEETLQSLQVENEANSLDDIDDNNKNVTDEGKLDKDPFAASDRINKPEETLVEGFKKDRDGSGFSDASKALLGLEVTTLPSSTYIGVEGFEGDYGGVEFSNDGSTLPDDFEGIDEAWGGGLDASEFVGLNRVVKDHIINDLEFLTAATTTTTQPPPEVKKPEIRAPEIHIEEEINAEFRESLLARIGLKGIVYLKTNQETEFSFKIQGTEHVKRFVIQNSKISSLGNGLFHVRTPHSQEPIPIMKYSLLPRMTPIPLRIRLVKHLVGTLLSVMIQYVSSPSLQAPLKDVNFVLKLPVDPSLLKVSPKAVLNRAERELKWRVDEIPVKGVPGKLRARMPVDIGDDDDGSDVEVFCRVEFSGRGIGSFSGVCVRPAFEGMKDFCEVEHRFANGEYICN